jgi:hypothetical protein
LPSPVVVSPAPSRAVLEPIEAALELLVEAGPRRSLAGLDTPTARTRLARLDGIRAEWNLSTGRLDDAVRCWLTWTRQGYLEATRPRQRKASPEARRRRLGDLRRHLSAIRGILATDPALARALDDAVRVEGDEQGRGLAWLTAAACLDRAAGAHRPRDRGPVARARGPANDASSGAYAYYRSASRAIRPADGRRLTFAAGAGGRGAPVIA